MTPLKERCSNAKIGMHCSIFRIDPCAQNSFVDVASRRRIAIRPRDPLGVSLLATIALIGMFMGLSVCEGMAGEAQLIANDGYVGSHTCISCHEKEHQDWRGSHHHAAMQIANEETVLGNFDNTTFTKDGVESLFFKRDGKFWIRTDGPDGTIDDFEIRYTFGVAPLQQYLITLPGGRYQALGIAWDTRPKAAGGQRWYHLYPGQALKAGDPLHWTGIDQNWNFQCAWCHSTNLQKNYSTDTKSFQTTWSEINVGCEACHGPAAGHLAWAGKSDSDDRQSDPSKGFAFIFDERRDVTWPMGEHGQAMRSRPRGSSKEIELCATCHARRQQFSSKPGTSPNLFDAFRPSLLSPGLYHTDGQQRDEVFTYGSFVQSRMHAAGVTCSDCHNPHSGQLIKDGNDVCAQCHAPAKFDTAAHHHHTPGSPGAQCKSCHMPTTNYMIVDARHDHSMRIPRPDQSVLLGMPNACNMCHTGKTASWARDAIRAWHPAQNPGMQNFAEAFDLADRGAPQAQQSLLSLANGQASSSIARASALARLRNFPSRSTLEAAARSLAIDDPLVRSAAIAIVANANAATRRTLLAPLLTDRARLVRMEAARGLAGEPEATLEDDLKINFDKALEEYVEGQLFNAERPESHMNLGNLYRDRGKLDDARKALETAIELDATFIAASVALADLERTVGNEATSEAVLRDALAKNANSGHLEHSLGLSLIRQKRTKEAMTYLALAAKNAPEEVRFSYVLAVALHDTGKPDDAISVLKNALARHPYDRNILTALANYQIERGNFGEALKSAELLQRLEPDNPDIARLLAFIRQNLR
jgi:predicted CXXCH cytochrome family protein